MRIRDIINIVEQAKKPSFMDTTPENIAAAKTFLLKKWKDRAAEMGRHEPFDLSAACKFSATFAELVFGGVVRGNFFHHWVETVGGDVLDLNDPASDVADMQAGKIPEYTKSYADAWGERLPKTLYTHNRKHMASLDTRDSLASVRPRVSQWAQEFRELMEI